MACTVINVCQEEPLLWFIPYSMVYLLIWLCRLYLDGNYLVSEKHIDHIKLKQFARKKSGQKAHENRRNKMMSKVRWIPKIHMGHPASSFSQPTQRGSTNQLHENNPVLRSSATIYGTEMSLLQLHGKRTLDGVFWDNISKMSFCTLLGIFKNVHTHVATITIKIRNTSITPRSCPSNTPPTTYMSMVICHFGVSSPNPSS